MRAIICDDDKIFLDQFSHSLEMAFAVQHRTVEIVSIESGAELFSYLSNNFADVIFLDIEMPDENGFSIAKRFSTLKQKPLLVFITNIETLVFESFVHEPIWYLLKNNMHQLPIVISKILKKIDHENQFLEISISNTTLHLKLSDIIYLESKDHYILLHTITEVYRFRGKLNDMETKLDCNFFIRCHASFLVNFQFVKALGKGKLILSDDTSIPISRNKMEETQDAFMNYKGSLRI